MKTSEFLTLAKQNIDTPDKWTTGVFARNQHNERVYVTDESACKFCLLGTLDRVTITKNIEHSVADHGYKYLRTEVAKFNETDGLTIGIADFNDDENTTHEQVMQVFDNAINKAKEDENEAK